MRIWVAKLAPQLGMGTQVGDPDSTCKVWYSLCKDEKLAGQTGSAVGMGANVGEPDSTRKMVFLT